MDKLFKSILGKYPNCQLTVQHSVPPRLSEVMNDEVKLKDEVFRCMATQLALTLLKTKGKLFTSTNVSSYETVYTATVYTFSGEELNAAMEDAYTAGTNSKKITD